MLGGVKEANYFKASEITLMQRAHDTRGSYKTWTGLWTGFWTGLWNACELSFKLVEKQVEMLKTAVVYGPAAVHC